MGPTAVGSGVGVVASAELSPDGVVSAEASDDGPPFAWVDGVVLACAVLACDGVSAGGDAEFEPGGRPSCLVGRQAESPSIRTGTSASPMRCSRVRHVITTPHLPDQNNEAMCITTLPIILPNGRDG